ncbi:hypothetical protein RSOLAG22IIIB_09737 [Rhizoctonia solani]|uniref:Uncharacterized protein n=1 Tax=Rhizoctonia solani TaxID=456999 RepID=A0A0K6FZS5_9AGAM|nr:hypothetical protein RSOLAG22IIIB_09737 [Rhizoctonia solani]
MYLREAILENYLNEPTVTTPFDLSHLGSDLENTPTLQTYSISQVWCYRSGAHDFLMLQLYPPKDGATHMREIWMRMERAPKAKIQSAALSSSRRFQAQDSYAMNYDYHVLMEGEGKKTKAVMVLSQFSGLSMNNIVDLVTTIRAVSSKWQLLGTNCRWFCAVTLRALRDHFHGLDMMIGVTKGGLFEFRGDEGESANKVQEQLVALLAKRRSEPRAASEHQF